ncbi:energy transducer TonB [Blastochloris tepida]|uniref:Cell envelope biogenesis protein TonB n=1 Tax=Blastochloris tepida TaxID=2233851 RepID=A0A348FZZ5_9HYPH|nr:energy transducer TonB [Blastochloris tepida]BBF92878.1 cell envelope biogenesis protein TonB [Blastochloris tepida]
MTSPTFPRQDSLRWGLAFAFAAAAHGAVALAVLTNWQSEEVTAGMPVVIELELMSASPDSASSESVPGPEQTQADLTPEPKTTEETEPEKTESPPEPETAETPLETEQAAVEPPTPDPIEVPETVPAVPAPKPVPRPDIKTSEVKKPDPKREAKKPERKPKRPQTAAATTAPSSAEAVASVPASQTFGHGASNALPNWNSRIVAHLQRHKRYPAEAQARGETGVARLSFTVDRAGHVIASRLTASSGHSSLDRETAELILRAQPLPPPPPELAGARFSFSVPIRYSLR